MKALLIEILNSKLVVLTIAHLGQWVLRGRCSIKIEARFEVGLERPAPSIALIPTMYLPKAQLEKAHNLGIKSSAPCLVFKLCQLDV